MRLTAQQRDAVDEPGNLLLTACPGGGKTRTLISKAILEIERIRGTPRRVCCITYTNTAAQEIEERTALELQPGDELQLSVSTIHSFCLNEILRPYGWLLPTVRRARRVIARDNPDFEAIARHAAAQINFHNLSAADFDVFESLSLNAEGRIVGLATQNAAVTRAAPYYWARCAELGYLDFATILYGSYRILQNHPHVALTLCSKYAWILVDEFQDTTELQIEILKLLYATGRSRFFLVGDLNQSIFAFTGARPELVDPFGAHLGARMDLCLSQNFRSSDYVVQHAERLFPRAPAMTADGKNKRFAEPPILIRGVPSIVAITEHFLPKLAEHGIALGDATILGKDWRSLIALTRELRDFGVPVVGPGARPYRRSRLFAALAEQLCGAVTERQPDTMRQLERVLYRTVLDVTGNPNMGVFSLRGRIVIIRLLKRATELARRDGAIRWLDDMSRSTGDILAQAEFIDGAQAGLFYASVQEMKADMARQDVDMQNLTVGDLGLFASPTKALRLSTIHYAKGREYGAVAMIGLRTRTFPDYRNAVGPALLGERRLFYVGVTRAEKLLMYVAEPDRWGNPPSPFLGPSGVNVL